MLKCCTSSFGEVFAHLLAYKEFEMSDYGVKTSNQTLIVGVLGRTEGLDMCHIEMALVGVMRKEPLRLLQIVVAFVGEYKPIAAMAYQVARDHALEVATLFWSGDPELQILQENYPARDRIPFVTQKRALQTLASYSDIVLMGRLDDNLRWITGELLLNGTEVRYLVAAK